MSARDIDQVKEICDEAINEKVHLAINEKIELVKTIARWCGGAVLVTLGIVVSGWLFIDGRDLYRYIHNSAFPIEIPEIRITPDTVLITAYSKDFVLRKGDRNLYESDFITFYAEAGQKVEYIISVRHRFFSHDSRRRRFFVEVDDDDIYTGPIVDHGGGRRGYKLRSVSSAEREKGLHKFGFRLDQSQAEYDEEAEVFVTCIILVSGKQYDL